MGGLRLEYTVIYERGPTGWGAYLPGLPGCVAVGKTKPEVEERIRKAVDMHLGAMRRDGDPIPEPSYEAGKLTVAAG
jgi:predicted RNase H-like HicB family nuclease